MPVLAAIRRLFAARRPLEGARIAVVFHLTKEVANLALTLGDGGAEILLFPSKKATIEPVAHEALTAAGIAVEAGDDGSPPGDKLAGAIQFQPHLMVDNAGLFTLWHRLGDAPEVMGSSVHSRSACILVEQHWEQQQRVAFPVIAMGSSGLKLELESTFGTGQSVIEALIKVTGVQLSGKRIAIYGYGNVGSGIARIARGMNARVLIVQNSPYRALKAVFDGYDVVSPDTALKSADIVLTATGSSGVLTGEDFHLLRDGVFVGNVGRSQEIDIPALEQLAGSVRPIDGSVTEYRLNGRRLYLMGGGHQFNHIAGCANSSEIMDLSLALHALAMEYLWKADPPLEKRLHALPAAIRDRVAELKLRQLGIEPFASRPVD